MLAATKHVSFWLMSIVEVGVAGLLNYNHDDNNNALLLGMCGASLVSPASFLAFGQCQKPSNNRWEPANAATP